jgi:outer membrane usher protein
MAPRSINRAIALAACVLVTVFAMRARADATALESEVPSELHAPFTLVVNHVTKGEMILVLKDGDVLVQRRDLAATGLVVPAGRDVKIDGQPMLSLKSVSPPLRYELDENDIVLRILAPPSLLPKTTIDLDPTRPEVVYRQDTSAFFNYAPRVNERGAIDLYDELGLSVEGNLLASTMYLSSERKPVRGLTNFTIDNRQATRRLVFGDSLASSGGLGSTHFIGGATLKRAYDLDPYLKRTPSLGFSGSTLTPATIDVYVNEARIRSEELPPGRFELHNVRAGGGSGIAKYVVRDVFGHEETFSSPFYVSSSVLAVGLDEYSYSFGALRDDVSQESWHYGHPAFIGRHRVGVTNAITVGGRADARDDTVSAGPEFTTLTPIGQFELELGASRSTNDSAGFASSFAYSYASRRFGAGLLGRFVTDRYATVDTRVEDDRTTREAGIFGSVPIAELLSLSVQASVAKTRDRGAGGRLLEQVTARLSSILNLTVGAGQLWNADGTTSWNVSASLNAVLPDRHSASIGGKVEDNSRSAQAMLSRSLPYAEGYGYRAGANLGESSSADLSAQYQTQFGRYGGLYRHDESGDFLALDAAGSLVIVPGVGLFPALPVQDGFGVIRVPGVGGVRGYLNNQELGRTDRAGNLLVPSLLSYYGNRLSVETEDIPMRYSLQTSEIVLAPPHRGAAVATFAVTVPHYCRGSIVIEQHGARVVPKYGELHVERANDEFVSPIGENGEFELEGIESGHHRMFIDYADGTCEMVLNIVSSSDSIVELGELVCQAR